MKPRNIDVNLMQTETDYDQRVSQLPKQKLMSKRPRLLSRAMRRTVMRQNRKG